MAVLYRKYRPRSFSDVIGQQSILNFLTSGFEKDKVPHALIFAGPRGTGKTTIARIVALITNCTKNDPKKCIPCLKCDSCTHILENHGMCDLIEIDAASNRGIDNIREINSMVRLMPHFGTKKVYLIDEAHMITKEAFNAFLKTLEEPPEHVMFILATTESDKFPDTILSRCQLLQFQTVSSEELTDHLEKIAKEEEITIDRESLTLIASYSEGCVRDAISLLEQVSTLNDINAKAVSRFLNIIGPDEINELFDLTLNLKEKEVHAFFEKMNKLSLSARNILRQLIKAAEDKIVATGIQTDEGRKLFSLLKNLLESSEHLGISLSPFTTIKTAFLETMINLSKTVTTTQMPNVIKNETLIASRNETLEKIAETPKTKEPAYSPSPNPDTPKNQDSPKIGIKDPIVKGLLMGLKIEDTQDKIKIYPTTNFIYEKLKEKQAILDEEYTKKVEIVEPETQKANLPEPTQKNTPSPQKKSVAEENLLEVFGN